MPTNLPPDYFVVEKRFREAQSASEKVALLEEMISIVPKHKGTDHLRADLRRQLSRLREEAQGQKRHGGHQSVYQVDKEGAGTAVLIGPTNVGKSALVAALTNAEPEVSQAPFTTWKPLPGMMPVMDVQVQLVDTPPVERSQAEPGLFDLVRHADLILLVVDLLQDPIRQLDETLDLLKEHRIASRGAGIQPASGERLTLIPLVVLVNKWDDASLDELFDICCALTGRDFLLLPVSAATGRNLQALRQIVFERLDVIRVYARPPGEEPDLTRPFVMKRGGTVIEMARKVHRDYYEHLKTARVWGSTAFEGQMVQRDYELKDGDIVELRI
jgi:ribosome-interacting GTPase 1